MGFVSVNGFMVPASNAKVIQTAENRCKSRCENIKDVSAKKVCELKCKIQSQIQIITITRRSAAQASNDEAKKKFSNDIKRAQLRLLQYKKQLTQASSAPKPKVVVA